MNIAFWILNNTSIDLAQCTLIYAIINKYIIGNNNTIVINKSHEIMKGLNSNTMHIISSGIILQDIYQIKNIDLIYVFNQEESSKELSDFISQTNIPILIHGYKTENITNIKKNVYYKSIVQLPLFYEPFILLNNMNSNGEYLQKISNILNHIINSILNCNRYIKKEKKKIKLLCNWTSSEDLTNSWSKFDNNNNTEIVRNNNDYFVIINMPLGNSHFIPNKTILFVMEPYLYDTPYFHNYNEWIKTTNFNTNELLYYLDHTTFRNNNEWHLSLNSKQLLNNEIRKTKLLSSIISSKYDMLGHKLRIDFLKYYQDNTVSIENKYIADIYGSENNFNLKNYKGSLPYQKKDDGIFPYKYTIAAENCLIYNYYTEKLIDAILGESLCFYWGCPNIEEYIDSRTYIRLDLLDKDSAIKQIHNSITNNEWEKRIDIIRHEKKKIINYYSFHPTVNSLIEIKQKFIFVSNLDIKISGIDIRKMQAISEDERTNKYICFINTIPIDNFLSHFSTLVTGLKNIQNWNTIIMTPNTIINNDIEFIPVLPIEYIEQTEMKIYLWNSKGEKTFASWMNFSKL